MKFSKELKEQMNGYIKFILEYESDTFSASRKQLTSKEAQKILCYLISHRIIDSIDGIELGEIYEELFEND